MHRTTTSAEAASDLAPAEIETPPGWATTEFYVALAPVVLTVVTLLCGVFHWTVPDPNGVTKMLAELGAAVSTAYVLGRSLIKAVHAHGVAKVIVAQTQMTRVSSLPVAAINDRLDQLASSVELLRGSHGVAQSAPSRTTRPRKT